MIIFLIKLVHSVIFIFNIIGLFYIIYCGIFNKRNWKLIIVMAIILIEIIILIFNDWKCPLTHMEVDGVVVGNVASIFLPDWFLPYVFPSMRFLFTIGILLVAFSLGRHLIKINRKNKKS